LCCQCGLPTPPNSANMCVGCIRSQVDITEGIPKQSTLYFCKNCERQVDPPNNWASCALESRELLAICLKKLKGLNKVRLIDAGFVWTEPHSKRIKVKLTIQKEVMNSTILQQVFVVEYVVQGQMCDACHRQAAQDFWKAVVQVRQKTSHKKTFFYLEQLIIKHNVHQNTVKVKQESDGIDFYYASKQDARKFVDFLQSVVPCRFKTSEKLISHDIHNNTFNYKYTFSVEIIPICREEVICLPLKLARSLGNIGKMVPGRHSLKKTLSLNSATFVCSGLHYVDVLKGLYIFLLIISFYLLHTVFSCSYDFKNSNINDENLNKMKADKIPDVILVKKSYGDKRKRRRARNWKLKVLEKEIGDINQDQFEKDYDEFLADLEEDKTLRQNVNIYVDRDHMPESDAEDEEIPKISLQEMLEDLKLEDAEGGMG
ncbi:predicted protein, partial [Nematostella vectensis]